jgi:aldehyde dehydrogenase (NAD+)
MREYLKFYIDGKWVEPTELKTLDVENPATEERIEDVPRACADDCDGGTRAGSALRLF